jgi:hypothetical protein
MRWPGMGWLARNGAAVKRNGWEWACLDCRRRGHADGRHATVPLGASGIISGAMTERNHLLGRVRSGSRLNVEVSVLGQFLDLGVEAHNNHKSVWSVMELYMYMIKRLLE